LSVSDGVDAPTMRRLLVHEARVHTLPGRELRDLGDAILLHDPGDPEPFWNRLEAVAWPADAAGFDRRLGETAVLFASLGRQPHIWCSPSHDQPIDLAERLVANGFEDVGPGHLMVARDAAPARAALMRALPDGTTLERPAGLTGVAAEPIAQAIVGVLLEAFGVEAERRPSIAAETIASLADSRFTHYLARLDGEPVAVARRATFDGLSYLSSIGTVERARGNGYGRLVTAAAVVDAMAAGSEWVHLGVFADNLPAYRLYGALGFTPSGPAGPDMVLIG
jgi:ribosomal protein S18 acetylase RimI-like enzyme